MDDATTLTVIDGLQRRLAALRREVITALRGAALPATRHDLLVCRVGSVRVALPLAAVEIVTLYCALTPLPDAPRWVPGLLDLRGELLPVVDLGALFDGATPRPPAASDLLVVCDDEDGTRRAALRVQAVDRVYADRAIDRDDAVHEVPHAPWVVGVARIDADVALVLAVPQLVARAAVPDGALGGDR